MGRMAESGVVVSTMFTALICGSLSSVYADSVSISPAKVHPGGSVIISSIMCPGPATATSAAFATKEVRLTKYADTLIGSTVISRTAAHGSHRVTAACDEGGTYNGEVRVVATGNASHADRDDRVAHHHVKEHVSAGRPMWQSLAMLSAVPVLIVWAGVALIAARRRR
jgi:hypothetical protein